MAEAEELMAVRDWVSASIARRVERVHSSGQAKAAGHASTRTWLRAAGGMSVAGAGRLLGLAAGLARLPEAGERFAAGTLSEGAASALCGAITGLDDEQVRVAEPILLALADAASPAEVARAGRYLAGLLEPGIIERRARELDAERYLLVHENAAGGMEGSFLLPPEAGARLRALLDAYARPRAEGDDRPPEVRNADAFDQLLIGNVTTELLVVVRAESLPDDPPEPPHDRPEPPHDRPEPSGTTPSGPYGNPATPTHPATVTSLSAASSAASSSVASSSASSTAQRAPSTSRSTSTARTCIGPATAPPPAKTPAEDRQPADPQACDPQASGPRAAGTATPETAPPETRRGQDRGTAPVAELRTEPGTVPGTEPRTVLGAESGAEPGAEPGTVPGTRPGTGSGTRPGTGSGAGRAAPGQDAASGQDRAVRPDWPPGQDRAVWREWAAGLTAPGRMLPGLLLATGQLLPIADVHRLARTSRLIRMVLDADGRVLNMGRAVRLATPAQRRALYVMYGSCIAEGCPIPAHLCQIDHVDPWAAGGRTDLDRLAPCCAFHNRDRSTHPERYRLGQGADGRWVLTYLGARPPRMRT
ncbi:DUF222 domain-containing protein [Streptosporangiaceae bacterium NEAU-GS5]|nr:DUF222 domain-containing protein [Streptosporangiaceae bacterium NEAU-GS5]